MGKYAIFLLPTNDGEIARLHLNVYHSWITNFIRYFLFAERRNEMYGEWYEYEVDFLFLLGVVFSSCKHL